MNTVKFYSIILYINIWNKNLLIPFPKKYSNIGECVIWHSSRLYGGGWCRKLIKKEIGRIWITGRPLSLIFDIWQKLLLFLLFTEKFCLCSIGGRNSIRLLHWVTFLVYTKKAFFGRLALVHTLINWNGKLATFIGTQVKVLCHHSM